MVICWLKDSGNEDARQRIIEASRNFTSISGVIEVKVGSVIPSERKIVDCSFDVAIYLSFKEEQQLNNYGSSPSNTQKRS